MTKFSCSGNPFSMSTLTRLTTCGWRPQPEILTARRTGAGKQFTILLPTKHPIPIFTCFRRIFFLQSVERRDLNPPRSLPQTMLSFLIAFLHYCTRRSINPPPIVHVLVFIANRSPLRSIYSFFLDIPFPFPWTYPAVLYNLAIVNTNITVTNPTVLWSHLLRLRRQISDMKTIALE